MTSRHKSQRVVVTRAGIALFACQTALLVVFAAAATLQPDGPLGSFLRTPKGFLVAALGVIAGLSIAGLALERFGMPITRHEDAEE